jgi:short-subunit dehydrogenase
MTTEIALVTGASAGLGTEFAKLLAADGAHLILVARRKDRLEALGKQLEAQHGIKTWSIAADLMQPGAAAQIVAEVKRLGLEVDVLINNAGFATSGAFATNDPAQEVGMVNVNVTALVELTRALRPGMVQRKRGRVLNIGSTAGFQPGPYMAVYYATKAFVNSFTEALWYELKGTGVTATVSCPGATATEFATQAGNADTGLFQSGVADSASVARHGYQAMLAGQVVAIPGLKNKLTAQSARFSPKALVTRITAKLNRR